MTLKEKILEVADNLEKEAFKYPKMRTIDVVNTLLRQLANSSYYEETKEEFAIEFGLWLEILANADVDTNEYYLYNTFDVKELLEIFKKEKGL